MRESSWSPLTVAGILFSLMVMLTGGVLIFQAGSGKSSSAAGSYSSSALTPAPTPAPTSEEMTYSAGTAVRAAYDAAALFFNATQLWSTAPVVSPTSTGAPTSTPVASTTHSTSLSATTAIAATTTSDVASDANATAADNTTTADASALSSGTSTLTSETTTDAPASGTSTAAPVQTYWSTVGSALTSSQFAVDVDTVCNSSRAIVAVRQEAWPTTSLSLTLLISTDAEISAPTAVSSGSAPLGWYPSKSEIVPSIPTSYATAPAAPATPADQSTTLRFHYFHTTLTAVASGVRYPLNITFPVAASLWQAVVCPAGYICDGKWVSMCIASQLWNNPCRGGYYCGLCYLAYYVAATTDMGVPVSLNASGQLTQALSADGDPWVSFATPHDSWAYRYAESTLAANMTVTLRLTSDPSVAIGSTDLVEVVDDKSAAWAAKCQAATPAPADSSSSAPSSGTGIIGGSGSSLWGAVVDDSPSKEAKRLRIGGGVTLAFGALLFIGVMARHCVLARQRSAAAAQEAATNATELDSVVVTARTARPTRAAVGTVIPPTALTTASVVDPAPSCEEDPGVPPLYPAALPEHAQVRGYLDVGGLNADSPRDASIRTETCE